jgi:Pyridoxamine 5'-phosphate oxidase
MARHAGEGRSSRRRPTLRPAPTNPNSHNGWTGQRGTSQMRARDGRAPRKGEGQWSSTSWPPNCPRPARRNCWRRRRRPTSPTTPRTERRRVIPVGFLWTGTEFVISTATTSPKVAALKARPDVALSIDGGDTPEQTRALSVRGRASVEIVDGLVPEYLAAARQVARRRGGRRVREELP